MTSLETDVERQAVSPNVLPLPSETSFPAAERVPLLADLDTKSPNYNTSSVINTESIPEDAVQSAPIPTKSPLPVLSLLLIAVFISHADGSLLTATYVTISSEFDAFGAAAWLTTSYTLAACAVQPIVGKLSDIYGRKAVLLISYAIFTVGLFVTGISQSMWQAISGRVISGLGAAGMMVIVSVLITDLVPMIQVAPWRSYMNVIATFGRSTGGPIGGFLADTAGWRLSFLGQTPIMFVAIILVALRLPNQQNTKEISANSQPSKLKRIDFIGAILLALAIVSFLLALSFGGQKFVWLSVPVLGLFASSIALGIVFVFYELRYPVEPVFPPSLIVKRDVATQYAIMALQAGAQFSMMFSIPLYFRVTEGASNTVAGSHLFPAVVGNAIGGLLAGCVIQRSGKYKPLTIIATILSTLTYSTLILRWKGKISILESLEIVPGGFGTGVVGVATFIGVTKAIEHSEMAVATGGLYLSAAIGSLAGLSISSSVQLSSLRVVLGERLTGEDSQKIIEKVVSDVGLIPTLEVSIRKIVVESYVKSVEYSHMVSLSFALLALILAFTIREKLLH